MKDYRSIQSVVVFFHALEVRLGRDLFNENARQGYRDHHFYRQWLLCRRNDQSGKGFLYSILPDSVL